MRRRESGRDGNVFSDHRQDGNVAVLIGGIGKPLIARWDSSAVNGIQSKQNQNCYSTIVVCTAEADVHKTVHKSITRTRRYTIVLYLRHAPADHTHKKAHTYSLHVGRAGRTCLAMLNSQMRTQLTTSKVGNHTVPVDPQSTV